jgi:hypothetical protein
MRIIFAVLLLTEICFVAGPFISRGINRPEAARAWHEWRNNPNSATEQAWKSERARLSRMNAMVDSVLVVLLIVNSVGLFIVGRKALRESKITHGLDRRIR